MQIVNINHRILIILVANMTQIVLCQPIYPSRLEHQNLFQPSVDPTIPSPSPIYSRKTPSSKPSGAFKLFKIKKSKKTEHLNPSLQTLNSDHFLERTKLFKLKKTSLKDGISRNNQIFSETSEPPCGYFDPNIAPLYFPNENQREQEKSYCLGSIEKIPIFPLHNHERIIVQKKPQQNIQILEESPDCSPQFQYHQQEPRQGDPFIIIKKMEIKQAKLKKMISHISKLPSKQKQQMNIQAKINSMTQLNDLKFKEIQTSLKNKEESRLQETEKGEHGKVEDRIFETKIKEKKNTKRTQCSLGDISECHSQFSLEEEHLFNNIFGSASKKIKYEDR